MKHRPLLAPRLLATLASLAAAPAGAQTATSSAPAPTTPPTVTAPQTVSAAPTPPAASARGSMFTDPVDGAFDAGAFILSKQGFLPVPVIITEPAVGYGAGLALLFLRYPEGKTPADQAAAAQASGQPPPRIALPNVSAVVGGGTENGTWFAGGFHLHNFNEGATRSTTILMRVHAELTYYGFAGEGIPRSYGNDMLVGRQQIEHKIGKSDWYWGGHYTYIGSDSVFDTGNSAIGQILPNEFDSATAGVGANLAYDSRDNPFTPNKGTRAQFIFSRYDEAFGGDFGYNRIDAFAATWWTLDPRLVLGWRIEGHFTPGDDRVPFYHQSTITLRGVPAARYQASQTLVNELELRYALTPRWSIVGFGGVGQATMDDPVEVLDADLIPAGGTGFRYLIARQLGMHVGCDFAWSEDDFGFYLTVGTPWQR